MSPVGQAEIKTQKRVIELFTKKLGYAYLGDWHERGGACVEEEYLRAWLKKQGHSDSLIGRALHQLGQARAIGGSKNLYDANREVYRLLRYGVKVQPAAGEQNVTVWLIDWKNPASNDFAVAEEVTVESQHTKRPDVVLYVNGIALGVLELKRSIVSVSEGIRQNLDNQKKEFIRSFFATVQLVMAGNDTEGLRYGVIETKEKYYLTWKEESEVENPLDRALTQLCRKDRLLELVHDFMVFDAGTKKTCRHNQYFGVRAAQARVLRREGGIIWHTQGSGKSLTMVWLAKWIRENVKDSRVLVITDRTELDDQIEKVFLGVQEGIYRTKSGADLIATLDGSQEWLICSLIHKFGRSQEGDVDGYVADIKAHTGAGFKPKGNIFAFVDECHRTQSGTLHEAMKALLPGAVLIGFTGTPLLQADKETTLEVFGPYIHKYRYDEAVRDGVVLDLRYEARDVDQSITSQAKIDQWFEAKTKGLTDVARAQLKQRWGTMQKVESSLDRLEKIVADILLNMATRDRLSSGHGNALLVADSIYQACRYYQLFEQSDLKGKCAIVTSYSPTAAAIAGEETGEGQTEKQLEYDVYRRMLADYFEESEEAAAAKVEQFEKDVKRRFVEEPGQMKLLIVVDMLLTGFDAPSATYLYIDKQMRDHGLFQAICRVNRLDTEDKEYGYVVDYKDLFKSLEKAIKDYTGEAFDGYEIEDVVGLLKDRLEKAHERLEEAREQVRTLCEPVEYPRDTTAYLKYFCPSDVTDEDERKDLERRRVMLYKLVASLVRAYANVANEMKEAGYSEEEARQAKEDVAYYEKVRTEVKLASGDYVDMKVFEPAMRHLLDTYIRAEESEKVSAFDDLSLVQLIVEKGEAALGLLPKGIAEKPEAMAEAIENNVRKVIIDEMPVNPKYYEKMSQLLEALIQQRKKQAQDYREYLAQIVELTKLVGNPGSGESYPSSINTPALQALYDNLDKNEDLAVKIDAAIRQAKMDDWRNNSFKRKKVRNAIKGVLGDDEERVDFIYELAENRPDY